jgi:hypothetical protein
MADAPNDRVLSPADFGRAQASLFGNAPSAAAFPFPGEVTSTTADTP